MSKYLYILLMPVLLCACYRNKPLNSANNPSAELNNNMETADYIRREIIYGRTYGTALTMDVFTPKSGNKGIGVVLFISEGWYSDREKIEKNIDIYITRLIQHGYTVFAVVHGSNPKFSLEESYEQAQRAMRFVRYNASKFGINPKKIGAIGDSAGGHLSLLVGSDTVTVEANATDEIDQQPCTAQAVVAFFPPTDFFNWGNTGVKMFGNHPKVPLKGAFTFYRVDSNTNALEEITDSEKISSIVKELSPIYKVHKSTSPTLIVYGDKDSFIPIQQSISFVQKLRELNVTSKMIVEKGGEHDEATVRNNMTEAIAWFDKYLK